MRVGSACCAAAAVLAVVAALLALPLQAQAQTEITLVSNLGQASENTVTNNQDRAQSFTPGTHAAGYTLNSIVIGYNDPSGNAFTVEIWTANAAGVPSTLKYSFTAPATFSQGDLTFTAPANATLDADTTYSVVMELSTGTGTTFKRTSTINPDEDSGAAAGWSIGDTYHYRAGVWIPSSSSKPHLIAIKGTTNTSTLSTDATLSDLELEDNTGTAITLTPSPFVSTTTSYTAMVANSVDEITIAPTVNDSTAAYEIQDSGGTALTDADSNETGFQVALSEGENTIKVEVTAEDNSTETYQVTVTRAPPPLTVRFEQATYSVAEGSNVDVKVVLSADPGRRLEIPIEWTSQGGADNSDYTINLTRVIFESGEMENDDFVFAADQDRIDDDGESVALSFGTLPTGVTAGSPAVTTVTITDDDTAGVTVSKTALTVTEDDTTGDTYTVVLDSRPTANVTITVGGYTGSDVTPNPASLTFARSDWNTAITVTVTAAGDADTTDDTVTLTHTATSTDPNYDAVAASVMVTVEETAAATGQPAITGGAQVGKTLTAGIGTIADADGLPSTFPADYTLQWRRVDADGTSNEADISGETSGTYTPVAADVGKKIKVQVSFTDGGSTAEGPLTSAAYPSNAPVAAAAGACPPDNDWCTTLTVGLDDQSHQ